MGRYPEKYRQILRNHFEIKYYDSRILAEINSKGKSAEKIHQDFVNFGIEKAVENLQQKEKEKTHILAFSVGGVIAWKYALKAKNVKSLTLISSTRLRYEMAKPSTKIELYFGEKDKYQPAKEWFENLNLKRNVFLDFGHEMYENIDFSKKTSQEIIQNKS